MPVIRNKKAFILVQILLALGFGVQGKGCDINCSRGIVPIMSLILEHPCLMNDQAP